MMQLCIYTAGCYYYQFLIRRAKTSDIDGKGEGNCLIPTPSYMALSVLIEYVGQTWGLCTKCIVHRMLGAWKINEASN
jgi:hypothetical protein